jgi:hypothetical protein
MNLLLRCLIFVLFLSPFLHGGESRLLLTGLSIHEEPTNQFGDVYNAFNAGIGYEYNRFSAYEQWYFSGNVMLFKDSFYNPQLTVGFGHAIRFKGAWADVAAGIAGFLGVKKLYEPDDRTGDSGAYGVMGGAAPMIVFYRGNWSLNLLYVPSVRIDDFDLTGFAFAYLGRRF